MLVNRTALLTLTYFTASPQWFGNLVTMQWWNDLWLNEGFAKFMEFVSTNITFPELQVVRLSGLHLYIINVHVIECNIVVRLGIWTSLLILKTVKQSCIWLYQFIHSSSKLLKLLV